MSCHNITSHRTNKTLHDKYNITEENRNNGFTLSDPLQGILFTADVQCEIYFDIWHSTVCDMLFDIYSEILSAYF